MSPLLDTYLGSSPGIAQGPGNTERIGNKISVTSLQMKFTVSANGLTYADTGLTGPAVPKAKFYYRYWVVLDTQCNGTLASPSDFLENQAAGLPNYLAFNNLENSERFRTLKTGTVGCPIVYSSTGRGENSWIGHFDSLKELYIKFKKPIPIKFDGATGALSELKTNNIIFFVAWESAYFTPGIDNQVFSAYVSRLRYVDL